ncbi:MAG TPA: thiamine pyrophosphate-dependent enzyme [Gemmatimonadaceae bacterium]|jgi:2-oxoglutarate ferredoxin oxidoreductase subunit beta|nr:thiamine pyrophosphate-dependent enzyme [Gemmatimonadaceae bacterium]
MTDFSCATLGCAVPVDDDHEYVLGDYEGPVARWCPGCGDHSILTSVEKLLVAEQLKPEQTMFVSGIGCSSRFPHYLKTYGFHGVHGRALPVATGIKLHRPDLNVFVVMGDGDCCSIGAAHWVHAIRYNMNMVALLLDNSIYGLTKKQTSPTTPQGFKTNTQPFGSFLPPLNPLTTMLGTTNVSFVAQTAEWIPAHLYATLRAAYRHRGLAFVRILQRCPMYTVSLYERAVKDPSLTELLVHDDGVLTPELDAIYRERRAHDPADINAARQLADDTDRIRLGVFFRDERRPCYDEIRRPTKITASERIALLDKELDRYAV